MCPPGTELPPILVNVGDLLSYWTGGLLRSTVHRVVFPEDGAGGGEGERYSMAYFCHPAGGVELGAVPSERVRREGKGGEGGSVLTADEHLQMRYVSLSFGFLMGRGGGGGRVGCADIFCLPRLKASYLELYKDEE